MILLSIVITVIMLGLELANRINHQREQEFYDNLAAASKIEYLTIEELKALDITVKPEVINAA